MRNLTWDCIDWDKKIITIKRTKNGNSLLIPMSTQVEVYVIRVKGFA